MGELRRMRRFAVLLAFVMVAGPLVAARAAVEEPVPCTPRVLVLSAMPVEVDGLLAELGSDRTRVEVEGRRFWLGTLRGHDAVVGLTGIGIENAAMVTALAFRTFACLDATIFNGVAGGPRIGDVTVPERWTEDGTTWFPADAAMLVTARQVAEAGVPLSASAPVGDPACACTDPGAVHVVTLPHQPEVVVGGRGGTSDPFGGERFPCAPGGGDVFGCDPCSEQQPTPQDATGFVSGMVPFADPDFVLAYFQAPPATGEGYVAGDMETAAAARVAAAHGSPFIAFRAVSDGDGDPLGLPGFPFQFFAYRQLAADNATAATLAFLDAWA